VLLPWPTVHHFTPARVASVTIISTIILLAFFGLLGVRVAIIRIAGIIVVWIIVWIAIVVGVWI
jgi:hypothetical protein